MPSKEPHLQASTDAAAFAPVHGTNTYQAGLKNTVLRLQMLNACAVPAPAPRDSLIYQSRRIAS